MRKWICLAMAVMLLAYGIGILGDLKQIQENVIRLHVVGASDSDEDQAVKLLVKDAVNAYLREAMGNSSSIRDAREILQGELSTIQLLAEHVLRTHGFTDCVEVTLGRETFTRRDYDTFSLPAGVYESLRIKIGSASGRNWWCVVFPTLCLPAAGEDLRDVTAGAGFSDELYRTITGEEDYEIRFFLLDLLGQFQNFWLKS